MTVRDDYGLPPAGDEPAAVRQWGMMVLAVLLALVVGIVIWAVDGPVVVAVGAVLILAFVFAGVFRLLTSRQLRQAPQQDLRPPRA